MAINNVFGTEKARNVYRICIKMLTKCMCSFPPRQASDTTLKNRMLITSMINLMQNNN